MSKPGGPAPHVPKTIGRYEIVEAIGLGAMGAVYKAFDPLIKRTLAIKTLRLDIARDSPEYQTFLKRFYHEARISGTLSHPNIVTLFDIGEDQSGLPFLVMEYVEGHTIEEMIEKGHRFEPERTVGIVSQIASALDYAHGRGVIHRDVKPSNLILFEGDRVKVTDFGIAKLIGSEMTQAGQLLGTPSYMSPEQAMGEPLDGRSDLFSLAVCAFEMLSGVQPFPGKNVTSILYKLVHTDPVDPPDLEMRGLVPQKWHEVFGKVLAKKPDDRYQTGADFVRDLEYCLGSWFSALPDDSGPHEPIVADDVVIEDLQATAEIPGSPRTGPVAGETPLDEEGTAILPGSPLPEDEEGTAILPGSPLPEAPGEVDLQATTSDAQVPVLPSPDAPPDLPPTIAEPVPDSDEVPPTVAQAAPTAAEIAAAGPGLPSPDDEPLPETIAAPATEFEDELPPTQSVSRPAAAAEDAIEATVAMPDGFPADDAEAPTVQTDRVPEAPSGPGAEATVMMDPVQLAAARSRPEPPPSAPEKTVLMDPPSPRRRPPQPAPVAPPAPAPVRGGPPWIVLAVVLVVVVAALAAGAWFLRSGVTAGPAATTPVTTAPPAPARPGVIRVESRPDGASVSLNGEVRGVTPLEIADLAPGLYQVVVELDGYVTRTESAAVTDEAPRAELRLALLEAKGSSRPAPVREPPVGSAEIRSTPPGAAVAIDGQRVGVTPLAGFRLQPGRHAVELSLAGHEPWSGSLVVERGQTARIDVPLEATAPAVAATPEVDVERVYLNLKSQVDQPARKVSGGSPQYPPDAPRLESGEAASVSVSFVVSREGTVTDLEVVESGGTALDRAVVEAVRGWKYSPALKRSVPVKVKVTIKQTFKAG